MVVVHNGSGDLVEQELDRSAGSLLIRLPSDASKTSRALQLACDRTDNQILALNTAQYKRISGMLAI